MNHVEEKAINDVRLLNGKYYVSEDVREHLKALKPENIEGLANAIEADSIRKHSLEENRVAWSSSKLLLQRHELSWKQLQSILEFADNFGLGLQIKGGVETLLIEINEIAF